jgi:hypothetical protein
LNGSYLPPTVVVRNETNRSIFGTSARTVLDPSRPASSRRLGLGHLQTKAQQVPLAIANPPDSQLALAEPPQKHPRDEHASERENEASFKVERLYNQRSCKESIIYVNKDMQGRHASCLSLDH